MIYYVVESGKIVEKFMCDNPKCRYHRTRSGMPMEQAIAQFQAVSMQKFDACSPECDQAIRDTQRRICV